MYYIPAYDANMMSATCYLSDIVIQ